MDVVNWLAKLGMAAIGITAMAGLLALVLLVPVSRIYFHHRGKELRELSDARRVEEAQAWSAGLEAYKAWCRAHGEFPFRSLFESDSTTLL